MGMTEKRRFPTPWIVEKIGGDGYHVHDANGVRLASVYFRDDLHHIRRADYRKHLTSDEARRIARAIARIPEFLKPRQFQPRLGFCSRDGGDRRWKPARPYHVALQDWYIRENWDRINALCAYNGVPFDATGQRIKSDGLWCVYEFARQVDAMMFWDKFDGRWMHQNDFFYPVRPDDMPVMKEPPNLDKLIPKNRR
jgi:hypothetical protein